MDDLGLTVTAPPDDPATRALRRLATATPGEAARATASLAVVLDGVRRSCWPEVAWRFSRLTASGCPLELSFSTLGPTIRWTAEVAGPELDNSQRLPLAQRLLHELAPDAKLPPPLTRRLAEMQRGRDLAWGAWLSGRHSEQTSRFKLYVEAPRDALVAARQLTEDYLGQPPLTRPKPKLEGIGCEPDGRFELYYRVAALDLGEIGALLARARLGTRQDDLLNLIELTCDRPVHRRFPRHRWGFSFAFSGDHSPEAFSLFCYAIDELGNDAAARRRLLKLAQSHGWSLGGYSEITDQLAAVEAPPTHHSVLAFTVTEAGPPVLTIGVAPPDA